MLKRKRTQRRVRRQRGGDGTSAIPNDYPDALINAKENQNVDSLQVPQHTKDFIEKSDASMDTTA